MKKYVIIKSNRITQIRLVNVIILPFLIVYWKLLNYEVNIIK